VVPLVNFRLDDEAQVVQLEFEDGIWPGETEEGDENEKHNADDDPRGIAVGNIFLNGTDYFSNHRITPWAGDGVPQWLNMYA